MVYRTFYLLGEDPKDEKHTHMIDIDSSLPFDHAQVAVADAFSIVDPTNVGFQVGDDSLDGVEDILDSKSAIAVTIDGHAVRDIPSPPGLPFLGTYLQVYPDHLGNHQRMFSKYGAVIKHTDLGRTTYLTNDPNVAFHAFQESPFWSKSINENHPLWAIKQPKAGVFVGDTDTDAWRVVHKFLPPALSPKAVRHYTPMMQRTALSSFKVFDELDSRNEAFNAFQYMFKMASQAVGKLALGVDFNHFAAVDSHVHPMVENMGEVLELNKKVATQSPWLSHLPFGTVSTLHKKQAEFAKHAMEASNNARAKHAGEPDLPIADAALKADSIADYVARAVDENGNKLPEEHFLPAMSVLLGAGFTTTASLMSWMLYSMVTYPGIQQKLIQELIDHGVTAETEWTFDSTNDLPYLDKFIKEVQRLHNPSYQPGRTAMRDQILPGGYRMPKDGVMICAIHHIHNNPAIWDNPAHFNPDRWDTDKVKNRPKAAYAPFATGPRSCIGFNFALQEVKTVMPTLLYRYEFEKVGDEPVEYDPDFQLIRPINLYLRAKKRTSWPAPSKSG